jgi:putative FmdB family regulatory protein
MLGCPLRAGIASHSSSIMPIYAYKCSACGHAKDVLQKISDDPLTVCPACGAAAFSKQVTAAGFQLKGAGWYVTDFRAGGDGANSGVAKPAEAAKTDAPSSTPAAAPAAAPAASPAPAPAPVAAAPKSVAPSAGS